MDIKIGTEHYKKYCYTIKGGHVIGKKFFLKKIDFEKSLIYIFVKRSCNIDNVTRYINVCESDCHKYRFEKLENSYRCEDKAISFQGDCSSLSQKVINLNFEFQIQLIEISEDFLAKFRNQKESFDDINVSFFEIYFVGCMFWAASSTELKKI